MSIYHSQKSEPCHSIPHQPGFHNEWSQKFGTMLCPCFTWMIYNDHGHNSSGRHAALACIICMVQFIRSWVTSHLIAVVQLYVCIFCVCICEHVHVCIYTYPWSSVYTYAHVCKCTCVWHVHVCECACVLYLYMCTYIEGAWMCVYHTYVPVCMCVMCFACAHACALSLAANKLYLWFKWKFHRAQQPHV